MEQWTPKPWRAWTGTQAKYDCVAQGRAGAILGGSVGSPICVSMRRTETPLVTKIRRERIFA